MDKGAVMRKRSPKESHKSKRSKENVAGGSSQTLLNIYTSGGSSPEKSYSPVKRKTRVIRGT